MTMQPSQSAMVSLSVHAGAIALLLLLSGSLAKQTLPASMPFETTPLTAPRLRSAMGGGGGQRQRTPPAQGHLPKVAPQFVPPTLEILNRRPKLAMEPSIEAPPEIAVLNRDLPNVGDPLSNMLGAGAGSGGPLGIGNGNGTGIGNRHGPGAGDGDSMTGTVYKAGKGVTMPVLLHKIEPEFSEEARKAKHSGTVMLRVDVDASGHPRNLRVVQSLGMGLDEKAMDAVAKWVFRPGTRDGKPVAVTALVEVMFHLL